MSSGRTVNNDFYRTWERKWITRVNPENLDRVRHFVELVPDTMQTALEIGARSGLMTELLAPRFHRLTAFDLTLPQLDIPGVVPVAGDATRLEFDDNTFDVVICAEVLEHIPPELMPKACDELKRVARHQVVIGVPNRQDLRVERLNCNACGRTSPPYGHLNQFDKDSLTRLFAPLVPQTMTSLGPHAEQTNPLSTALMNWAGNPMGTYSQHEPCPWCDTLFSEPPPPSVAIRAVVKAAHLLNRLQNRVSPTVPAWLHAVFIKIARG